MLKIEIDLICQKHPCYHPHIRFGEISIRQIAESIQDDNSHDSEIFYKELVWREFSYHLLLFHFPSSNS